MIHLLQSSWFCVLGGTWWPGWLLSVVRQRVRGCPAPAYTQGDTSDGAFGPGSGLSCASGSSSSRGTLICFAVAPVAARIVALPGDRVALAALVTCVLLAPPATEDVVHGPPACLHWDHCRSWVPWKVAAVPQGQRGCFCRA